MPLQHLKNSPLVEAVFELRFPGEPAILSRMDQYFDTIREQFPDVWVPESQAGVAPALQPWEFKNKDSARWIAVSINSFAFHVLDYVDYQNLKEWGLPLALSFCDMFNVKKLSRIGARFKNHIILLRIPGQPIPLDKYLNLSISAPSSANVKEIEDIHLQLTSRHDDVQLTLALHHVPDHDGQPESLCLDLDCALIDDLTSEHLDDYLDKIHACAEDLFANIIAEPYMEFMKGEDN